MLSHYSLLDEKMRLGRNRYTGVTTTDASSKFGESPPRTSDKSTNSGAVGESGDAQLEISNSSFRSVMESVLQLRAIDSIVSNTGADAAAERENKVSDSIKKNCDLFELWESIRYATMFFFKNFFEFFIYCINCTLLMVPGVRDISSGW